MVRYVQGLSVFIIINTLADSLDNQGDAINTIQLNSGKQSTISSLNVLGRLKPCLWLDCLSA